MGGCYLERLRTEVNPELTVHELHERHHSTILAWLEQDPDLGYKALRTLLLAEGLHADKKVCQNYLLRVRTETCDSIRGF